MGVWIAIKYNFHKPTLAKQISFKSSNLVLKMFPVIGAEAELQWKKRQTISGRSIPLLFKIGSGLHRNRILDFYT